MTFWMEVLAITVGVLLAEVIKGLIKTVWTFVVIWQVIRKRHRQASAHRPNGE
jgi:hypothetical protein